MDVTGRNAPKKLRQSSAEADIILIEGREAKPND